jgi:hypothetical protein
MQLSLALSIIFLTAGSFANPVIRHNLAARASPTPAAKGGAQPTPTTLAQLKASGCQVLSMLVLLLFCRHRFNMHYTY